ncbi:hypothetical protein GSI_00752 [Ganoderma sinense ZZ0214-1]|uniref:RRM domain-containing protein n=1 Tax=Ganoderma sinense ZZ0214-1 TaxID=1077348 RepID=A0A2G8STG9_9APHY|nr:hypothetical protein GSI_00752 [Ganoderma sinense ZZ0214-1]
MSVRGRSLSPRPLRDEDVDMDGSPPANSNAKVVIVTNLTRNVMEPHLQAIFGFYGEIVKVDLPVYGKSGQNRGKAALEFLDSATSCTLSLAFAFALSPSPASPALWPWSQVNFPLTFPLPLPSTSRRWWRTPWWLWPALQRRLPPSSTPWPQAPSLPPLLPFPLATVPLAPSPWRGPSCPEAKVAKLRAGRDRLPWSL